VFATDEERIRMLEQLTRQFSELVPLNKALGLRVEEVAAGIATMRLPYDARFIGNPETGVLHGGAVTALMDACCGMATFMALRLPAPLATLDLRIDYLGPSTPGLDVVARCTCFKVTRHVAFVRGVAFHGDESDAIAAASGSFILSTRWDQ
jgi:uncharacterized protein (TIGR00369 family)